MPRPARPTRRPVTDRSVTCAAEPLEGRRLMSTVVALASNTLFFFDSATPDQTLAKVKVRGLARREQLVGIDFRPATGQLYGVGDSSRLYLLDPTVGTATVVGTSGAAFDPPLAGLEFGLDFNPVADRLRVTSDADQNLRLDPTTGAVVDLDPATAGTQSDLALAYATGDVNVSTNPAVTALAYSRAVTDTTTGTPVTTTTAYGIDVDANTLVTVGSPGGTPNSPNSGVLTTVGLLGVDPVGPVGFDIGLGTPDVAYASIAESTRGRSTLYTVDPATGISTAVGPIAASRRAVRDIAVAPAGQRVLALDAKGRLYTFDSNLPNITLGRQAVTGLARRERLLGMDVRPADGGVYAFSNQNRLYRIDPATAAAAVVGSGATTDVTLNRRGLAGVDVNPVADALRVVNSAGENLRVNLTTGQIEDADPSVAGTQLDTPLVFASTDANAGASPLVSGIAYSNNAVGAAGAPLTTTLYGIDSRTDNLVTIGTVDGTTPPNSGQLFTVGALGVDVRDASGFEIVSTVADAGAVTNTAYAAFRERRGGPGLYVIDLTTGAATRIGTLGKGVTPIGIAILSTVAT